MPQMQGVAVGWSMLLQMQTLHVNPPCSCLQDTDSGLLCVSRWHSELLKLWFSKDFCSVIWNKLSCAFHLLYKTKENTYSAGDSSQSKIHLSFPKPSQRPRLAVFISSWVSTLHFAVTELTSSWHYSATLQEGANKGSTFGFGRTRVLHPMFLH